MMKKIFAFLLCVLAITGCSKHDPVLSGVRKDIFESNEVVAINKDTNDAKIADNIAYNNHILFDSFFSSFNVIIKYTPLPINEIETKSSPKSKKIDLLLISLSIIRFSRYKWA